ncbi:unnamed protein product [Penicillium pancosmium]
MSWLVKALYEEDQSAPPGHQALNEDGRLMIIAGIDTTGTILAYALYYLTKNPHANQALQKDLVTTFFTTSPEDFTNDKLQTLPYLDAIINETLRLKPAVPSGQPRQTPPAGLQIDEVWIPGNTIVVIPQYVLQRDARYFPSGDEFILELWLASSKKDGLVKYEEAFFPFQLGQYGCIGKQLALMQLRAVIARIAYDFDMGFAEGEDGVAFDGESMDTFTFTLGGLRVVFKDRNTDRY